jgi:DNA adenine methylase
MFDLQNRAKPPLKWAGGKSQILSRLVEHFPARFDRLIEPFLGGAAVSLSLKQGIPSLLNDSNFELINLYSVIKEQPLELMSELDSLAARYSNEFYYQLRAGTPSSALAQAARTVFLNKTGFNGLYRQNRQGRFNVPFGHRPKCPALYDAQNVLQVSRRLQSAELRHGDFATAILDAGKGDFVYCDPPYEPLSRTSSFNAYTLGGFSQDEQRRLRDACSAAARRGAVVAISNSAAPFILDLFAGEQVQRVAARRSINSKGSGRGVIDEVLVLFTPDSASLPFAQAGSTSA